MQEKRNDGKEYRHPKILLRRCKCGKYHLHYKYVMLTFAQQTLFAIMKECYEWEMMRDSSPEIFNDKPLKISVGFVDLTISGKDFDDFNAVIQQGTTEALQILELLSTSSGEDNSNEGKK